MDHQKQGYCTMNPIRKWIKNNEFENMFDFYHRENNTTILIYRSINEGLLYYTDLFECYMTTVYTDKITGHIDISHYQSIEDVLFAIDKTGIFKTDLKWQVIIKLIQKKLKK